MNASTAGPARRVPQQRGRPPDRAAGPGARAHVKEDARPAAAAAEGRRRPRLGQGGVIQDRDLRSLALQKKIKDHLQRIQDHDLWCRTASWTRRGRS